MLGECRLKKLNWIRWCAAGAGRWQAQTKFTCPGYILHICVYVEFLINLQLFPVYAGNDCNATLRSMHAAAAATVNGSIRRICIAANRRRLLLAHCVCVFAAEASHHFPDETDTYYI